MLIHPWDAPHSDSEWQQWLAIHDFGQLAVNGPPGEAPSVQPTHFLYDAERGRYGEVLTHLARPNPLCKALETDPHVLLSVVDDPAEKAGLLNRQVAHFQPEGGSARAAVGEAPYGRMLSGIRGLRLEVTEVRAKFKYGSHKPQDVQDRTAAGLTGRAHVNDLVAHAHHRRRRTPSPPSSPSGA
ncbi:FMN-binding negative transcriptional regulator [Streptomyces flavidovirens]